MAMNPLPPQAYTKDTLLRAYAWLQNQNPSIRGMATTPDILVSLFLKTTRDGEEALERPSIQNFKNELKSLAGLMGELEIGQRPVLPKATPPAPVREQPRETVRESIQNQAASSDEAPAGSAAQATKTLRFSNLGAFQNLDILSHEMLHEIKIGFNLSDESEAIRMLIKLGYEKAKKILIE